MKRVIYLQPEKPLETKGKAQKEELPDVPQENIAYIKTPQGSHCFSAIPCASIPGRATGLNRRRIRPDWIQTLPMDHSRLPQAHCSPPGYPESICKRQELFRR
ncbi:hypothetical protein AVEN_56356-1 [Araneus ventricosus]|uniref:Uncharacterized protein n=1 Tax=Araneus ventricosus TaxID=182803 RepID=A0A4Y2LRC6_ARAVE|nr:hypothetical protein AVEN_56356-1 [Araneus ventricosus]